MKNQIAIAKQVLSAFNSGDVIPSTEVNNLTNYFPADFLFEDDLHSERDLDVVDRRRFLRLATTVLWGYPHNSGAILEETYGLTKDILDAFYHSLASQ